MEKEKRKGRKRAFPEKHNFFAIDDKTVERIDRAVARFNEQHPGIEATRAGMVRNLLSKALTFDESEGVMNMVRDASEAFQPKGVA